MRYYYPKLAAGLAALLIVPLGGCATTGSVKRAQTSADSAGTAAQRAQSTADSAGTSAQSANDAAGRAQTSADAAATAAQGASSASSAATASAQSANARLDTLSRKVAYLEKRERARHPHKRRKRAHHHAPPHKPDPSHQIPPYQSQ